MLLDYSDSRRLRVPWIRSVLAAGDLGEAAVVEYAEPPAFTDQHAIDTQPTQDPVGVYRRQAGEVAEHFLGQRKRHTPGPVIALAEAHQAFMEAYDGVGDALFGRLSAQVQDVRFARRQVPCLDVHQLPTNSPGAGRSSRAGPAAESRMR